MLSLGRPFPGTALRAAVPQRAPEGFPPDPCHQPHLPPARRDSAVGISPPTPAISRISPPARRDSAVSGRPISRDSTVRGCSHESNSRVYPPTPTISNISPPTLLAGAPASAPASRWLQWV